MQLLLVRFKALGLVLQSVQCDLEKYSLDSMADEATFRRTDAKAYFANERTFLHWMNMSVTLGSIAAALAGVSGHVHRTWDVAHNARIIAIRILSLCMLVIAIAIALTAAFNFQLRCALLRNHADGPYSNRILPTLLSISFVLGFGIIFVGALASFEGWK
eukprot:TRINITY_DN11159_c0_g2_i2.p2 TRINITY_DN11159_c0_g2~~TRINITY_DN11159_c0_g2_i2.p2  ORF type:complete len:160 (+),score=17.64 TRINITY_DN11159_c0_g2_i2:60-539(+)